MSGDVAHLGIQIVLALPDAAGGDDEATHHLRMVRGVLGVSTGPGTSHGSTLTHPNVPKDVASFLSEP